MTDWRAEHWGKTPWILSNPRGRTQKEGVIPKGLLTRQEAARLREYFKSAYEHDYTSDQVEASELPALTESIQKATGLRPVYYYGFVGAGPVGFHDDRGSDIDTPTRVAFCLLLKTKQRKAQYHPQKTCLLPSFEVFYFLNGDNGRMWQASMEPGQLVFFDPAKDHGIMTSQAYYLLCGLAEVPE
jgi:hypothetical protein